QDWGAVQQEPVPLRALYFLYPSTRTDIPIAIAPLDPLEGALLLQTAMYSPSTLRGERARRALEAGDELTGRVRLARVSYHRDYDHLAALRARLRDDRSEP